MNTKTADAAYNNLATAIITLDSQYRVQFLNDAAENFMAMSGTRLRGRSVLDFLDAGEDLIKVMEDARRDSQAITRRKSNIRLTNGLEATVDITVSPVVQEGKCQLLLELQQVEHLSKLDQEAMVRNGQDHSRELVRALAHEIKNPLGGIRGAAELLSKELPRDDLLEYTQVIIEETDRLKSLVDKLLGPNVPPRFERVNIHEILEKVRLLLSAECREHVEFLRDYDPSLPSLTGDEQLLFQAILNVARNGMQALDLTDDAPTVTMVTRAERQFTIGGTKHRLAVRIDIVDNGCGVPEGIREQIFYPLITGRDDGTGLGLSVTHTIVSQHGGHIEFDSEPGRTRFSIILPLESGDE